MLHRVVGVGNHVIVVSTLSVFSLTSFLILFHGNGLTVVCSCFSLSPRNLHGNASFNTSVSSVVRFAFLVLRVSAALWQTVRKQYVTWSYINIVYYSAICWTVCRWYLSRFALALVQSICAQFLIHYYLRYYCHCCSHRGGGGRVGPLFGSLDLYKSME